MRGVFRLGMPHSHGSLLDVQAKGVYAVDYLARMDVTVRNF